MYTHKIITNSPSQIIAHLPLSTLLSLSLTSKLLRHLVLSPSCESLWLSAAASAEEDGGMGLPVAEMEAPMKIVEMAWLVVGKWCRMCHKNNARKVDYHLRTRLCSQCWSEHIVYEGPDEPDPAFEEYFPGTKRYTPRSRTGKSWKRHKAFFFAPTLTSTSSFLRTLLSPQLALFHSASDLDPLAELDDYLSFSSLPSATQEALDERQEWVRRVWRDGERVGAWERGVKERERRERREERGRARGRERNARSGEVEQGEAASEGGEG
ncbi:hypothetical protein JCM11251_002480 [Rhodosporidiobolus azoricus]